ncbi:MAG: hypothetical protein Q8K92_13525, partial [Leadbetterella sp.]|nr:hypothetical protein [Leadbetterella sp.]
MSKKIKLTLSPFQRKVKPTTDLEKQKESNRINSQNTRELTLEELGEAILNGQSFSHAVFSGERSLNTFLSSQLIVLDIDNKKTDQPFSLGDALNRLAENGLGCNMAYTTFSDSTPKGEKNPEVLKSATRYRLIIMLPEAINDLPMFESILKNGFYTLFPEADRCGANQFWFAGNNVLHVNLDYELDMELMLSIVASQASSHYISERRRNECLRNFAAIHSEKMVVESDVHLNANLFNKYKSSAVNRTNSTPIRNYDWEWACSQFNLLSDFINCKRKIYHHELMYLYLGMRKIEGGAKKWKESVERNELIDSAKVISIAYYFEQRSQLEGYPLFETKISKYAPDDPVIAIFDYLSEISKKRSGKIIDKSLPFDMPLEEAEKVLAKRFDEFFSTFGNGKYILKCATGLGKTEMIISRKDLDGCIVAVPTHKLKIQHSERRSNTIGDYLILPELPELPPDIKHEYNLLMKVG